jgi:hypothetical protein
MKCAWIVPVALLVLQAGCQASAENAAKQTMMSPTASPAAEMSGEPAGFEAGGRSSLTLNRQIIYTAHQEVRVENVSEAEKKAQAIVKQAGGFISDLDSNQQDENFPRSSMTARVPAKGLEGVLEAFGGLGREVSKTKSGEDVTDQLVDMEARLRALRAEETAYLAIMKATRKVSDVIEVQKELIRVRTEIEQIDAQRVNLKDQVAFSSITLVLSQTAINPPGTDGNWASETWSGATSSFGSALRNLASAGIWILVYLPIWGGCTGLVIGLIVWTNRRAKKAQKPPVL